MYKIYKYFFILILSILLPNTLYATTWIVNGTTSSAYTNPDPYDNYSNITTNLTIPGAEALEITITGETENNYDFLYVTDASSNTETFDGTISTTYTVIGDSINVRFTSDYSVTRSGVTVTISSVPLPVAPDICPGTIIPNLDGTGVSATDAFNNITVPANTIYYYSFTPTVAGTLQTNSSASNTTNSLYVYSGCGGSLLWSNTSYGGNKSSPEINVLANQQIIIAFERDYFTSTTLDIDFTFTIIITTPPIMGDIPDQNLVVGTSYTLDISNYVTLTDGDPILFYTITGTLPLGISFDTSTGILSGTPTVDGTFPLSVTATDKDGVSNADSFNLIIDPPPPPNAVDDTSYSTEVNTKLIIAANGVLSNDSGQGLQVTSNTTPNNGTVTVNADGGFTYTPPSNFTGTATFTYEITDNLGSTDTAIVIITVGTSFTSGQAIPFVLINPDYSRNVIGDYRIAGNTVLCLTTNDVNGYGGTCTDDELDTSNNNVSKYLDIDNNSGTWNSTSSNIDLTDTAYDPRRGVIWAGLFWGGRISSDNDNPIRYAVEDGANSFNTIEVGAGGNVGTVDVATVGSQNIKLGIDNGGYSDILSSKFHVYESSGGETYAAYADVTSILQSANLNKSKHTFTIANLTTMEGQENSPGAFGGWSLVLIYAEDYAFGKPRNISIYNGFVSIGSSDTPIEISGFKLPTSGNVEAQLSVFSGEGEHLYGYRSGSSSQDWLKISRDGNTYEYMPGLTAGTHVGNRDNSFNAQLDNIDRDNIPGEFNNLAVNNVGVDIDNYDVSELMTDYRNLDENISSINILTYSNNDFVTVNMIAFSAELYVPNLCYDYTLDIDGYVLESTNNAIQTPFGNFGAPLTTSIYLKSLEGDIDLSNINVNYNILDTSEVTYRACPTYLTYISETGEYDYTPVCEYTHNSNDAGFDMYIGTGKTISQGGIISAFEDRYIKFDSNLVGGATIDTSFEFSVDYTVDYGSGAVPLRKIFTPSDLCEPTTTGFLPQMGSFNVTDITNNIDQWNLYTQISKRAFDLRLYAHAFDPITKEYIDPIANDLNLSVEIEMIRADNFNRDANTACNDENSILRDVPSKFVNFANDGNGKVVEFGYTANELNFAYRSLAMRVWYLTDVGNNGNLVDNHNCTYDNQDQCIELYDDQYGGDTNCQTECRTVASSGNCYECLRNNYGRKVCSRDNFSIRPESFITEVFDSNESNDIRDPNNKIANSVTTASEFSLISGYNYRFDINATSHTDDIAIPRYIQHFEPGSPTHSVHMNWWPDTHTVSGCNDVSDKNITLSLFNGSNVNLSTNTTYVDLVDQIGKYRFEISDQNWSSPDWDNSQMLHHTEAYAAYYIQGPDCVQNSDNVSSVGTTGRQGCTISSLHTNNDTGTEYNYLYAQYYPYSFDVTRLNIGAGPTNGNNFVYVNTLDSTLYPNSIDENMSYNIQGTFAAIGKDNGRLSNFVENCYADSLDMGLYQYYNHNTPTTNEFLTYDLIDYNTSNTSTIIRTREQGEFAVSNIKTTNPIQPLIIAQGQQYFKKDMNGSITMDLGYNFTRANNIPLNPRFITMSDFNITYSTQPATVYVDLISDYKISGNRAIDQNISFVYGRAKSSKTFYDDITTSNVDTPISIVLYCDLGYAVCQNRGILALLGQTSDDNWWKSVDHDQANGDGNIELFSTPNSALNATTVNITSASNGVNDTINVNNGGVTPLIVPVNLRVNDPDNPPVPANYTDRWLIYNEASSNTPPIPFYRVRFIGNVGGGWVGYGDTGHVVDGNVSQEKNRRLEW